MGFPHSNRLAYQKVLDRCLELMVLVGTTGAGMVFYIHITCIHLNWFPGKRWERPLKKRARRALLLLCQFLLTTLLL